jgi:glycogen operon protein
VVLLVVVFRFELAPALRGAVNVLNRLSAFFDLIQQDPVISQVKLIAEPWDIGEGGYQVGNFPSLWSEWNGKYRDTVRDFWRGAEQTVPEFANRVTGSSDLYEPNGRRPNASINFVTAHDGFTLRDLVSYDGKHNDANGEQNRDGDSHSRSWNCGVEGETDDPAVLALRARQQRNVLATLFLSQGVPMLLAGDELGKTQGGNNNAYCQDNELSWIDWEGADTELLEFTRNLIRFASSHPVFCRRGWFQGHSVRGSELRDIGWFRPDGSEMSDDDWNVGFAKSLAFFVNGRGIPGRDRYGRLVVDDDFYVILSAFDEPLEFQLPAHLPTPWKVVLDTPARPAWTSGPTLESGGALEVASRSVVVLTHPRVAPRREAPPA